MNAREELRRRITAAPLPFTATPALERLPLDEAYEEAVWSLAHALLVVTVWNPALLDTTTESEQDPTGFAAADNRKLWEAAKNHWPGINDWLGGITGFQWGEAHNAVRLVLAAAPVGNPALVEITEEP